MKKDKHFKELKKYGFDHYKESCLTICKNNIGENVISVGIQNYTPEIYLKAIKRDIKKYFNCEIIVFKKHFKIVFKNNFQKRFLPMDYINNLK